MDHLEKAVEAVKEQLPGMSLKENEPMSAHSSFRIFPSSSSSARKSCRSSFSFRTVPSMPKPASLWQGSPLLRRKTD